MGKRLLFILFAILFCSTTFGQVSHWETSVPSDCNTTMTIITTIQFDGIEQNNPQLELGVFNGDKCRAAAFTEDLGTGKYVAWIDVKGKSGESYTFKVYDHATGEEKTNYVLVEDGNELSDTELSYVTNAVYGEIDNPYAINFKKPNHYIPENSGDDLSMSITAIVKIDGVEQKNANLELGAFINGVVKGSVKTDFTYSIDGAEERNYARMNISGSTNGDVVSFKLFDHSTNKELEFTEVNTIVFENYDNIGSIAYPLEVNFITASYVAKIGDNQYLSFEAALTAAVDGNEIILLENITLEENPTVVSKDINIKLNGKTVSGTIKLAHTGATVTGVAEAMTVTSGVEGYIVVCENNVYSLSERQPSGQVAYRAYINDSESREAVQVDLTNVYAKTLFVVELLDANDNVLTTTSLKAGGVDAESYTCNIVLWGTESGSWDTEIKASKLTVANIPATINVYADGTLVDTYANALGAGTNVDETEKYKALDCVYKEAKIGETLYATFAAAYEKAATDNEIILLANVDFAETTVSKDININLNNNTVTGTIVLANTGATVTCAEDAVNVTTSLAGYKVVFEDGMYKLVAKNYVAQVGDVKYESIQEAVDAAQAGNEIVVIAAIDGEDVVVDKNVTISGSVTLNDVSINAVEGADELTVSGLSFTGNSWINSGTAEKLTVSGVTANVTPSNTAYTNSRSAFISLGRSEQQQLELYVTNCNIVANGGADPILGWAAITKADIIGNTFGSESAYQTNSDCVKFMAIAQGAVFNITGNTIYSNYNGIVFGQNTTRDNAYTVNVDGNTFKGNADHIWIEVSGSNTTHATVKATSNNTVNGSEFTANDIKLHPNLNTFTSYAGVDVVLDVNGKVLGGTFKYVADGVIADGYKSSENADGTYSIVKKLSGEIAYRAYVTDTESVEAVSVDLSNVYASSSLKVELYNGSELLVTTAYAKTNFPIDADSFTCFMVLSGTPDEYWNTTINAEELTIENLPTVIKLYVDGELVDTFDNALGAGTNVDETEDYKALDCVYDYEVAKVGDKVYWNINNAIANWTAGSTLTLLANVTLSDVITLKSTEHHILNLDKYTMTAAAGKNAIEITCNAQSSETYALTVKANSETPGGIIAGNKSCIYYKKSDETKDRPIITIENGVFNGEYSINIYSSNRGTNCPTVKIANGTFNGNVNIAHGKLITTGGIFNGWINCTGDVTAYRLISGGTFKQWLFMTTGPSNGEQKFTVGKTKNVFDCGVYVDDKGYLVVGGDVITEAGGTFEASSANYSGWSTYLQYSSAATNGLYYTSVEEALADNNKTTSSVNIYVSELDLTGTSYKGTLVITEPLTVTFPEGTTPAWTVASGVDDHQVGYTESVENSVVTRVYTLFTPVAQVGETYYATLQEAIDATTSENTTVKVLKDITLEQTATIAEGKTVVLDLNGKTINAGWEDQSAGKHIYAFTNNGTLTIKDSSTEADGTVNARGIFNYGTMTLVNGTINAIDGDGGYGVRNYSGASFTMNAGTIATTLEDDNNVANGGYDATPVRVDEGASFIMIDGTINNICDFTVAIDNYGTTTIEGGTITSVHTTVINHGTMTIDGGSFTCDGLEGITAHALWAAAGTTTINGGTFDGKDNYNGFNVDASEGATVYITGGNFLQVHSGSLYGEGTIAVSGGTFFDAVPEERCAAGYIPTTTVIDDVTYYTVKLGKYVAKVNGVKYESLDAAIDAAQANETITMLADVILTETLTIEKAITLNLNNKTVTGADDAIVFNVKAAIKIENGTIDIQINLTAVGSTVEGSEGLNVVSGLDDYGVNYYNGVYSLVQIVTQSHTLSAGWNWFSSYVDINGEAGLDKLQDALNPYGVQIKGNGGFTQYTEGQGWFGPTLESASVKEMYMINMSADHNLQLTGELVAPAQNAITLVHGWNWIGYQLNTELSVSVAIKEPKDGDRIKSHQGFSQYYKNESYTGWWGTLETMTPGYGYMYYNANEDDATLKYSYPADGSKSEVRANITSENNYWVPASSRYAGNMNIVAMFEADGDNYEIAAFVGGEVRGSARPIYVEPLDAYMFFLTVHGEDVEEMTFRVYDLATGEEYNLNDRMNYTDNAIVGSITEPYIFRGTVGVGETSLGEINVYPNPTTIGNEINLGTECDTVEVFNALGVKVAEYQNVDSVDALETAGVYVIRITNNGNVQNCRLIVK